MRVIPYCMSLCVLLIGVSLSRADDLPARSHPGEYAEDLAAFENWLYDLAPPPKPEQLKRMEQRAHERPDDSESAYWLYAIYRNRLLSIPEGTDPMELLNRAAASGAPRAQAALAYQLITRPGGAVDKERSGELFKASLAASEPHAFFLLGMLHLQQAEQGNKAVFKNAVALLTKAKELGHKRSWAYMAKAYSLANEWQQAHALAKDAADLGDPQAYLLLADWHLRGAGVEKNSEAAVHWLTKAAEAGQVNAQLALARMYLNGENVEADAARSFKWYQAAADAGDLDAKFNVARALVTGGGTPMDIPRGRQMLLDLANQDHGGAQFLLGRALLEGLWLDRDLEKARQMMQRAAENGVGDARYYLEWFEATPG